MPTDQPIVAAPDTVARVIVEPSAWMRGRIAERRAAVRRLGFDPNTSTRLVMAPLGKPGRPGTDSDRECDRCAVVSGPERTFWCLAVPVAPGLTLFGGLCSDCASREGWIR